MTCGEPFGETGSSPVALKAKPGLLYQIFVAAGFSHLIGTFLPVASIVSGLVLGGMYGPVFRNYSPALYLTYSVVLARLPYFLIAIYLLRRTKLVERIAPKYRAGGLFACGVCVTFLYLAVRIFAATVPGGGASFAVASYSPVIVLPALIVLAVAAARFLFGAWKIRTA